MVVTLIGTGNVGTHLLRALQSAGHETVQLQGRTFRCDDVRGEVVIVCVKDDTIAQVAERLKETKALVVHTSGSVPLTALPCRRRGVLYPMQTFSKTREVNFCEVPVFLEAENAEDMKLLVRLASTLTRHVQQIDSDCRRRLHLAAVLACNFVNHCYDMAAEVLHDCDLPFSTLLPLIDETARKVHQLQPREAQTGPAVRFDQQIILRQEVMLAGREREIYHLMSENIHDYHDKL